MPEADRPGPAPAEPRSPASEPLPAQPEDRQRRADAADFRWDLAGYVAAADASHGTGARNGLPAPLSGPGRGQAVADGLYRWGHARSAPVPAVPEGEGDAFDAPPLPYMRVERAPEDD